MVEASRRDAEGWLVCETSIEHLAEILDYSLEHLHSLAGDLSRAGLIETQRRRRAPAIRVMVEA
jgi:DNA-binding IscR family transcriptional regulator